MKSFLFTLTEGKAPRDGSGIKRTVRVYRIRRNKPEFVGTMTEAFQSPFHMVMEVMESKRALPRAAFARNPNIGGYLYSTAFCLERAGFASVVEI